MWEVDFWDALVRRWECDAAAEVREELLWRRLEQRCLKRTLLLLRLLLLQWLKQRCWCLWKRKLLLLLLLLWLKQHCWCLRKQGLRVLLLRRL